MTGHHDGRNRGRRGAWGLLLLTGSWLLPVASASSEPTHPPAKAAPTEAAKEPPASGEAVPELAALDRVMRTFMRQRSIPAGTLAVMKDGRLVFARGYGFLDSEKTRPVPPDTPMRIASVGKPITAAAIRKLISQGKLRADSAAFPLLGLKPLAGSKPDPRLQRITIAHLLDHRGGWDREKAGDPMFRSVEIAAALDKRPPASSADVIRYMMGQPLQFAPGARSVYSNFGYCVLGQVIEKVSGQSYCDYIRKEVLAPLGIHSIELGHTLPRDRSRREPFYSAPGKGPSVFHASDSPEVPLADGGFYLEAMAAHGGLIASAPDLVRFLQAYWTNGEPRSDNSRDGAFFGSLPGTFSLVHQRRDGVNLAVLFNQSRDPSRRDYFQIKDDLDKAVDGIAKWPTGSREKKPAAKNRSAAPGHE